MLLPNAHARVGHVSRARGFWYKVLFFTFGLHSISGLASMNAEDCMSESTAFLIEQAPSNHLKLADRMAIAHAGDWCVLLVDDQALAWRILKDGESPILEEWGIPNRGLECCGSDPKKWEEWLLQRSSEAVSHTLFRWNSAGFWSRWDPSSHHWRELTGQSSVLASLFQTPLQVVAECHQKRTGPRPRPGTEDTRPLWKPTLGKDLATLEVWSARFCPKDDSEESVLLTVWLTPKECSVLPPIFPLHVEAERGGIKLRCRTIAAGRSLIGAELSTKEQ